MKNKSIEESLPFIKSALGSEKADIIARRSYKRLNELLLENAAEPKAVKAHTETDIFPAIAMYEAMQYAGMEKAAAEKLLDKIMCRRAEKKAQAMRTAAALPGAYKLMPRIFEEVARKSFGEAARFKAEYCSPGPQHCKFNMTKCLYLDTCRRYGCEEITKCFCHVDDVTDGNIHPRLVWARTKTMAEGGDCCDFELYVK